MVDFFLVGEPKSGTTALHEALAQHPGIFLPEVKEPNHFCTDLHEESDRFHGKHYFFPFRSSAKYYSLYTGAGGRLTGDASPTYSWSHDAAANIAAHNPQAKIVIIFREPVDFLESLHNQLITSLTEDITSLESALAAEPKRRRWRGVPKVARSPRHLYYSELVAYSEHLARFRQHFPSEQILVLFHEDFRRDNLSQYRRLLAFLGLDTDHEPCFRERNTSKEIRFRRLRRLVYSPTVRRLAAYLPGRTYARLSALMRGMTSRPAPRQALDSTIRERLAKRYATEVHQLDKMVHEDLCMKWGYLKEVEGNQVE